MAHIWLRLAHKSQLQSHHSWSKDSSTGALPWWEGFAARKKSRNLTAASPSGRFHFSTQKDWSKNVKSARLTLPSPQASTTDWNCQSSTLPNSFPLMALELFYSLQTLRLCDTFDEMRPHWGSTLRNLGWIETSGLNGFSLFLGAFPVLPRFDPRIDEGRKNEEMVMYSVTG